MAILDLLTEVAAEHSGYYVFALGHAGGIVDALSYSITFPVNPERFQVQTGGRFVTFETLRDGEMPYPRGRRAERVRWTARLPGLGRFCGPRDPPEVNAWAFPPAGLGPTAVLKRLSGLMAMGEDGRSRLIITRPYVNMACYVESLDWESSGAFGDVEYTVSFVEARDIGSPPPDATSGGAGFPEVGTQAALLRVGNALDPYARGVAPRRTQGLAALSTLAPRQPVARSTAPVAGVSYDARGGETWLEVAHRMYGDAAGADVLRMLNGRLSSADVLPVGARIDGPRSV